MIEDGAAPLRALVFGATGFIGKAVVERLLVRGARVDAVVRRASLVAPDGALGVEVVTADLEVPGAATALVEATRPSHVFNLAGYGVDRGEQDDARADQLNHRLPRELAEACAPRGNVPGPVLVHVGSAAEYGSVGGTFTESGDARPFTAYGRTKLAGTLGLRTVAAERGTLAVTARLFTVFGDGEHEGRLFPSLVAAAAAGRPIDLTDGQQRRDFAFVGDVAEALVDLADAPVRPGDVVNIASGRLHSVETFVRTVAEALGMPEGHLRFGALASRSDEMEHEGVWVERMRALLGRSLSADLSAAVRRAIARLRGTV